MGVLARPRISLWRDSADLREKRDLIVIGIILFDLAVLPLVKARSGNGEPRYMSHAMPLLSARLTTTAAIAFVPRCIDRLFAIDLLLKTF